MTAKNTGREEAPQSKPADFPRHTFDEALRAPRAILDQNGGRDCTQEQAARFVGMKKLSGDFNSEIASAIKYGLLRRPVKGSVGLTELARQILRPQSPEEAVKATQRAVLSAPGIRDVYEHYRGEYMPDSQFFANAVTDKFKIPSDKVAKFREVFENSLTTAKLAVKEGERIRFQDSSNSVAPSGGEQRIKTLAQEVKVTKGDVCFVMMPFASPIGGYYDKIYKPAVEKAGLTPVRADTEIFATGKIIDQVWRGINSAKVLVAELTTRNANVFYELGLAHALNKPVVLVSGAKDDVPFDLQHIRVIYYEMTDPFWGQKLMEKITENILSALSNPEEALFKRALESKD